MACAACAGQRTAITQQFREGNVSGTFRAVTMGARMVAEKMAGVDINAKYGFSSPEGSQTSPSAPAQKVYTRT